MGIFDMPKMKSPEKTLLEQGLENIFKLLDEKIRQKTTELGRKLEDIEEEQILKEILWDEYGVVWKEDEHTKFEMSDIIKKRKFLWPLLVVLGFATKGAIDTFSKKDKKPEYPTEDVVKSNQPEERKDSVVEYKQPENKQDRYYDSLAKSLPEKGAEVYGFMGIYNPTPGKAYMILDKKNAVEYIFDKDNKLIAKVTPGFGKDEGDEKNTSVELGYDKGKQTTPAGVYLMSNASTKSDIEEYGKNQFALIGISILGDKIFLGEHQTYTKHNQLEIRTEKLNTLDPSDNKFSNGCINIDVKDFEKYVKPNFAGDYGELVFVLPDSTSEASGVKFEVSKLIKQIMPIVIEMSYQEEAVYVKAMATATPDQRKIIEGKINSIKLKRSRAQEELDRTEY